MFTQALNLIISCYYFITSSTIYAGRTFTSTSFWSTRGCCCHSITCIVIFSDAKLYALPILWITFSKLIEFIKLISLIFCLYIKTKVLQTLCFLISKRSFRNSISVYLIISLMRTQKISRITFSSFYLQTYAQ